MNSDKQKILTVAIPAYGRPETLETLVKQFQNEDSSKFNLLICDDASPNDLSSAIKKYESQMPNLTFIRNEKNLGFSGNVCKLFDIAKTDFIWFVCDDDAIIPGCINKVVSSLEKYDPTVAVFNHIWTNPYGIERQAAVTKDKIYESVDKIKNYNDLMRMTFLSTLILKRISSSDNIRKTDYQSNVFIQITLGLELLSKRCIYAQIAEPIIHRRVGFKYGEFFKFYTVDHLRAIFAQPHRFNNKKFIDWSIAEIPVAFQLYMSQKLGLFSYKKVPPTKRTIKEVFYYYGIFGLAIFAFIPIYFLTPKALVKFIYKQLLYRFHDKITAEKIYNQNIDRAFKDERKTGFTEYR